MPGGLSFSVKIENNNQMETTSEDVEKDVLKNIRAGFPVWRRCGKIFQASDIHVPMKLNLFEDHIFVFTRPAT